MNKLAFLELELEDFKSFTGKHVLQLDRKIGLHFVRGKNLVEPRLGSNGSGKSTIWDAVCWCLFGRTPAGLKNPDITPWQGKGSPRVSLLVEVNGRSHAIERTSKPNTLRLNGKDIGQDQVVKLIRMDIDIFTNTTLMGQRQPLFFDRDPREKMTLFNDALNLDRWDERSKLAGDEVKSRQQELAKFQGEAGGHERTLDELGSLLEAERKKEQSWKREYEVGAKELRDAIISKQEHIQDTQHKVDGADLAYDGHMAEVFALESHVERDGNSLRNAKIDLQRVKDRKVQVEGLLDSLEDALAKLKKGDRCPTCGQSIKGKDLAAHWKEIEQQLDRADEELKALKIKPYQEVVEKLEKSLADAQGYLRDFRSRAHSHLSNLGNWKPELAKLKAELQSMEDRAKVGDAETNPHTAIMRTLRKRQDRIQADLDDCKADIVQVEKELERYGFWVKGFKEIKLHIVDEILQELQLATDGMLEDIGLVGWRVSYVIESETKSGTTKRGLQVLISSPKSKGKVRWESWSGGEGQRLKIVGALALSQVLLNYAGVQPDMEVLDEPAEYFSQEGIHDLCAFLAERARTLGKRIYYIDHVAIDSSHFASVIPIERDKAGSRLVEKRGSP